MQPENEVRPEKEMIKTKFTTNAQHTTCGFAQGGAEVRI